MEQIQIRALTVMSWILLPIFAVIIGAIIFIVVRNIITRKVSVSRAITSAVLAGAMFVALKWIVGIPPIDTPAGLRGMLVSMSYVIPIISLVLGCLIPKAENE